MRAGTGEGGVRVAALVSGGFLPSAVRGRKLEEPMHECDWYSTFARLAGVAAHDEKAAAADPPLPPVDSIDLWDLISGTVATSPRREWAMTPLGESTERDAHGGDAAYMLWPYKLIVGRVEQSGWCGQIHPNNSKPWDSFASVEQCSPAGKVGCLFNVVEVCTAPLLASASRPEDGCCPVLRCYASRTLLARDQMTCGDRRPFDSARW